MLVCDLEEVAADELGEELGVPAGEGDQEIWIVGEGRIEGWVRGRVELAMDAVIAALAVDWAHHRPGAGGHLVVMVVVTAVAAIIVGMAASGALQSEQTPALVCDGSGICRRWAAAWLASSVSRAGCAGHASRSRRRAGSCRR